MDKIWYNLLKEVIHMKRIIMIILLLIVTLLLVGCGSGTGIKNGEFTFTEEDFIEEYEEHTGKLAPGDIFVDEDWIDVFNLTKTEMIEVMEVVENLTGDEKMSNVINTFKEKGAVVGESENLLVMAVESSSGYTAIESSNDGYTAIFEIIEDEN